MFFLIRISVALAVCSICAYGINSEQAVSSKRVLSQSSDEPYTFARLSELASNPKAPHGSAFDRFGIPNCSPSWFDVGPSGRFPYKTESGSGIHHGVFAVGLPDRPSEPPTDERCTVLAKRKAACRNEEKEDDLDSWGCRGVHQDFFKVEDFDEEWEICKKEDDRHKHEDPKCIGEQFPKGIQCMYHSEVHIFLVANRDVKVQVADDVIQDIKAGMAVASKDQYEKNLYIIEPEGLLSQYICCSGLTGREISEAFIDAAKVKEIPKKYWPTDCAWSAKHLKEGDLPDDDGGSKGGSASEKAAVDVEAASAPKEKAPADASNTVTEVAVEENKADDGGSTGDSASEESAVDVAAASAPKDESPAESSNTEAAVEEHQATVQEDLISHVAEEHQATCPVVSISGFPHKKEGTTRWLFDGDYAYNDHHSLKHPTYWQVNFTGEPGDQPFLFQCQSSHGKTQYWIGIMKHLKRIVSDNVCMGYARFEEGALPQQIQTVFVGGEKEGEGRWASKEGGDDWIGDINVTMNNSEGACETNNPSQTEENQEVGVASQASQALSALVKPLHDTVNLVLGKSEEQDTPKQAVDDASRSQELGPTARQELEEQLDKIEPSQAAGGSKQDENESKTEVPGEENKVGDDAAKKALSDKEKDLLNKDELIRQARALLKKAQEANDEQKTLLNEEAGRLENQISSAPKDEAPADSSNSEAAVEENKVGDGGGNGGSASEKAAVDVKAASAPKEKAPADASNTVTEVAVEENKVGDGGSMGGSASEKAAVDGQAASAPKDEAPADSSNSEAAVEENKVGDGGSKGGSASEKAAVDVEAASAPKDEAPADSSHSEAAVEENKAGDGGSNGGSASEKAAVDGQAASAPKDEAPADSSHSEAAVEENKVGDGGSNGGSASEKAAVDGQAASAPKDEVPADSSNSEAAVEENKVGDGGSKGGSASEEHGAKPPKLPQCSDALQEEQTEDETCFVYSGCKPADTEWEGCCCDVSKAAAEAKLLYAPRMVPRSRCWSTAWTHYFCKIKNSETCNENFCKAQLEK